MVRRKHASSPRREALRSEDAQAKASHGARIGLRQQCACSGFPSIVPSSVLGAGAPSNRINIGAIGTGRISRGHDLPGLWKHPSAPHHGGLRSRQQARAGRHHARQRPLHQDDRQAVRRRHRLRALPRAARQQGRRRGRHQHARSLARADRHRRRRGGQGRLPAEAGVADDRRGPGAQQRRASHPAASSRSAASSGRRRSSATPPSWCATAASAS